MVKCPAWYSKIDIKPCYENDVIKLFWDIPEYYGSEEEDENRILRPDGKLVREDKKVIYVLEMSVPWLENRDIKYTEKEDKYVDIVQRLKVDHPSYDVVQLTFIMDSLGGYSNEIVTCLQTLDFKKAEVESILYGMQKIILTEAVSIIRRFKIRTK